MKSLLGRLAGVILIAVLAGCANVKFVEDYDAVLDQGLTDYQGNMAAFMARMAALSNDKEGEFDHPDVQAFYARQTAQLVTFVDRAEALDSSGKCLPANYLGKGIQAVVTRSAGVVEGLDLPLGKYSNITGIIKSYGEGADEVSIGNCTVVMLKALQDNHAIVMELHETNGSLPKIVVDQAWPLLDQSARIAIRNEIAKKNRGEE